MHKSVAVAPNMEASLKYTDENLHALQKTAQNTRKRALCANRVQTRRFAENVHERLVGFFLTTSSSRKKTTPFFAKNSYRNHLLHLLLNCNFVYTKASTKRHLFSMAFPGSTFKSGCFCWKMPRYTAAKLCVVESSFI